ncbi:MAG: peptidase M15 family protein [Cyanobacteria bacterium Co-bin8]|nr:peptidase M15 family protein [Cyanobacteria bacterium Co-bin8]
MKIKAKSDTLFKLKPKLSNELSATEKVFVKNGTEFEIEYYVDVGSNHWQIELLESAVGDAKITSWYIFRPDFELKTPITLKVVSDTLFKLEPKLSSELTDIQKIFVKNGTQFEVASYLPAASNHTRLALANATLGPNRLNSWYAYTPDIKLQGDRQELKVVSDTLFKAEPALSSELSAADKIFVKNGTVFELSSYGAIEKNHVRVALQGAFLGPGNRNTWYAYAPDIQISGNIPGNRPNDQNSAGGGGSSQPANPVNPTNPANPVNLGKAMRFPGFDGLYYTNNPIIWTTAYGERGHFTWGEATHGGTRIPENQDVVYGMIRVAKALEDIRYRFGGRPMSINSWYRPPAVNAAVGGASQSRHLAGDAADFVISGYHPYDVFDKLDAWWGNKGGLASASVFTHIDTRGYRARWSYGY